MCKGGLFLKFDGNQSIPIYIQIAQWLETEILRGNHKQDEKIYSQYQLADMFNINPATAAKGLNILADEEILYKKRGLGKFVSNKAEQIILTKRKNQTLKKLINDLVIEAERLRVSEEELVQLIKAANRKGEGESK